MKNEEEESEELNEEQLEIRRSPFEFIASVLKNLFIDKSESGNLRGGESKIFESTNFLLTDIKEHYLAIANQIIGEQKNSSKE